MSHAVRIFNTVSRSILSPPLSAPVRKSLSLRQGSTPSMRRPQGVFVEVRHVAEAERRAPRLELLPSAQLGFDPKKFLANRFVFKRLYSIPCNAKACPASSSL